MLQFVCASLCSMICSEAYSIVRLSAAQVITHYSDGLGMTVYQPVAQCFKVKSIYPRKYTSVKFGVP